MDCSVSLELVPVQLIALASTGYSALESDNCFPSEHSNYSKEDYRAESEHYCSLSLVINFEPEVEPVSSSRLQTDYKNLGCCQDF